MKKSEFISQVITTNWSKYKSTSKLSEEFDIPLRTIQHYILKMYRDEGIVLDGYIYRDRPSASVESEALEVTQTSKEVEDFNKTLEKSRVDKINTYQNTFKKTNFVDIDNGYVVVFSDAHYYPGNPIPVAHQALLSVIGKVKPKLVVANGDIFDFNSISKHGKNGYSRIFSLKEELNYGLARLEEVKIASNGAKLLYTAGNHDQLNRR